MSPSSALYIGSVMHRRRTPQRHRFRYRAFWCLIDLDELQQLDGRLRYLSYNKPNVFSLYDRDHGDGSETPLRTQVECLLQRANCTAGGSVRLLCMPRTLGYCFNPLSIYYCYAPDESLAALIYQVHNTFGERHSYVVRINGAVDADRHRCKKTLYVSPFLEMDMRYDFRITEPAGHLAVAIKASASGSEILRAVMCGARQQLTDRNLLRCAVLMPAITLKVIAAIHWEALKLWLKGVPLVARPQREAPVIPTVTITSPLVD